MRPEGTVYAGYWEFPGGKCEPGEDPADASRRECLEETGLAVRVVGLRRVTDHTYPHGPVTLSYYDAETVDPSAEPGPSTGFVWVDASDLPGLRFPEANGPVVAALALEHGDAPPA